MDLGPYARFSPTGALLGTVGRQGSGPGEFGLIRGIELGEADSVIVLEPSRLTVMSDDGRPGRVLRLPGRMSQTWQLPDGGFFAIGLVPRGQSFLPALHVLAGDGRLLRSFGPPVDGGGEYLPVGALNRDGSLWIAVKTERGYKLENWTSSGQRVQTAEREVDWSALDRTPEPRGRRLPLEWVPSAAIQAIGIDPRGYLIVSLVVPSPRYWEVTPPSGRWSDMENQYDSVIGIVDPQYMRLHISARIDTYITHFLPNGFAVSKPLDPATGEVLLDVSRLSTHIPTRR
jgi:hypothetical protein